MIENHICPVCGETVKTGVASLRLHEMIRHGGRSIDWAKALSRRIYQETIHKAAQSIGKDPNA